MPSYNKVILMGNLTRDPEMKFLPSGESVTSFGLAMNEQYNDKETGEKKQSVNFVEIEAWGKQGEVVNEYLVKGSPIFLEGSLKYSSWETEGGEKRSRIKVRLNRFQFIGSKNNGTDDDNQANQQNYQGNNPDSNTDTETDDSIPF